MVAVVSEDRPWSAEGELALLAFTDLAALLIASMMQNQEKSELAVQLQGALDSRRIIEQAKGVLMGRHGIPRPDRVRAAPGAGPGGAPEIAAICAEVVDSVSPPADDLHTR